MRVNTAGSVYVIAFSAVIATVFTGSIMALHVATQDAVARNERLLKDKAIVELFGLGDVDKLSGPQISDLVNKRIVTQDDPVTDPQTGWSFMPIFAYKTDGKQGEPRSAEDLIGLAFPIEGVGFWAPIRGLMAVTPDAKDAKKVIGVVFLSQRETPGLGGRITERKWRAQFAGLDVTDPGSDRQFVYIGGPQPTGPGDPKTNRRVDAITGATQTSLAVERFINESLRRFRRAMAQRPDSPEGGN